MAINQALTTIIKAGTPYYRATSIGFRTNDQRLHKRVVNGQGALANANGSRYNFPGAVSVYLTETLETCLAEKLFYFQRSVIRSLDIVHTGWAPVPAFTQQFVVWEVVFKHDVKLVCDLTLATAPTYFHIFPALLRNPSQDYEHLKQRRAEIQAAGYLGLRAPSSRSTQRGNLVVLFGDQSSNVQSIVPYSADIRLITTKQLPFVNHTVDSLDFTAGEVEITGTPGGMTTYQNFALVSFHH